MIAKLLRGFSKLIFGEGASRSPSFHPLPQLPTLGVSRQAVEKMHACGGIMTDEDVENLGILKKTSDAAAKNANRYSELAIAISKNEITIADAYEKARQGAEKSQVKQEVIQNKGWQQSQQLINQATDAIAAAGGGEL